MRSRWREREREREKERETETQTERGESEREREREIEWWYSVIWLIGNFSPQTNIDREKCPHEEESRFRPHNSWQSQLVAGKVYDIMGREPTTLYYLENMRWHIIIHTYIIIYTYNHTYVDLDTQSDIAYITNNMEHPASRGCLGMVQVAAKLVVW